PKKQEDNILQDTTKNSNDNNVSDIISIMEISKTKDSQDKTTKSRSKKLKTNYNASDTIHSYTEHTALNEKSVLSHKSSRIKKNNKADEPKHIIPHRSSRKKNND
ncbi:9416_t:CDS:2, partial [Funneliformis geosporum]